MTLLLDAQGQEIPEAVLSACPKCERQARELISGFGGTWKELCSWCGHEFAHGTGEPPLEDA